MRIAAPLLCLVLGACAGIALPTAEPPAPQAASAPPPPAASPPAGRAASSAGGARGGAATAAARAPAEPVDPGADPLTQARADCWMKVEGQKSLRGIDQRIAYVDKCVTDQMKNVPQ
jgi:hypothetical protein